MVLLAEATMREQIRTLGYFNDYCKHLDETSRRQHPSVLRLQFVLEAGKQRSWAYSYTRQHLDLLTKHGVTPDNINEVHNRLLARGCILALTNLHGQANSRMPRRTTETEFLHPGMFHKKGKYLPLRAYLSVIIVTGNRAKHVMEAASIKVRDAVGIHSGGLEVKWRKRKIRGACKTGIFYPFCWSSTPPDDVLNFIRTTVINGSWGELSRRYDSENMARVINDFLKYRKINCSSSCPRQHMSTYLQQLCAGGWVTGEAFALLLDHTVETGQGHYRLNTDIASSAIYHLRAGDVEENPAPPRLSAAAGAGADMT